MKSATLINSLVDGLEVFFNPHAPRYIDMFFANANTDYAEVRLSSLRTLVTPIVHSFHPFRSERICAITCSSCSGICGDQDMTPPSPSCVHAANPLTHCKSG
jgi:hypothetical protein